MNNNESCRIKRLLVLRQDEYWPWKEVGLSGKFWKYVSAQHSSHRGNQHFKSFKSRRDEIQRWNHDVVGSDRCVHTDVFIYVTWVDTNKMHNSEIKRDACLVLCHCGLHSRRYRSVFLYMTEPAIKNIFLSHNISDCDPVSTPMVVRELQTGICVSLMDCCHLSTAFISQDGFLSPCWKASCLFQRQTILVLFGSLSCWVTCYIAQVCTQTFTPDFTPQSLRLLSYLQVNHELKSLRDTF